MEKELHVLYVDDDEDEYVLLKDMFNHLPGQAGQARYRLDWVATFEEGLERAAWRGYDLHLVDYHLGRRNGIELLREARAQGIRTPSILLTGQGSYELDREASEQGMYDYLLKDQLTPALLERAIRYALERRQAEEDLERRVRERTQDLVAANKKFAEANAELEREMAQRAEMAAVLRESESRFRALADTTSAAIFIVQDGLIRYANPATRFVTGFAAEELVGTELWRLAHPTYQGLVRRERVITHWASGVPARYEIKIVHKDGSPRWLDMTAGQVEFNGSPARVFTAFDITERDTAERNLRKARDELEERVSKRTAELQSANRRLEAILLALPVGILIAGADGSIQESNQAFNDLWGVPEPLPNNLQDWPVLKAWNAETGQPVLLRSLLVARTALQGETILGMLIDAETPQGARKTILYSSVPLTGTDGEITGGVAVTQDISFQRQLEQEAQSAALVARQRAEALEGLHRATAALLTTLDLDELLCQILDAAQSAIPAGEKGMLHLVSPFTGQLQARATLGFTEERTCVTLPLEDGGPPARMARNHEPLLIGDMRRETPDPEAFQIPDEMRDARSIILAPLYYGEHVLGTISLCASQPYAFNDASLRLLASFAATTTAALQNAILHAEIKQLAVTDPLTGEYNRRAFFELGQRELERFFRLGHPLAAIMIDLDNFKLVNDAHGHLIGDQILRSLAEQCKESIRGGDIFGRYGGDEFALLLPDTDLEAARQIAARIRDAVMNAPLPVENGPLPVSVSLGVTAAATRHHKLEDLLSDADQALYLAKTRGRNRVEVWENKA